MAGGCGFENRTIFLKKVKKIVADGWRADQAFCDAVADEIIAHPRISRAYLSRNKCFL
jgi:hypothetical protein